MAECIWCSEYSTNEKNPCMSFGSWCSPRCSSLGKQKNPFDVSVNIKVVVFKKTASTEKNPRKSSFSE